jgi:hypothetical protein
MKCSAAAELTLLLCDVVLHAQVVGAAAVREPGQIRTACQLREMLCAAAELTLLLCLLSWHAQVVAIFIAALLGTSEAEADIAVV